MAKTTKIKPSKKSAYRPNTTRTSSNPGGIARPETKASQILALLSRGQGATLEQLMKETGWQQHSLRGYVSGNVKNGSVMQ